MAILGIDEVGRGPLAGPLVVGAVILPEERPDWVSELKDSKKLSAKKREELNGLILDGAVATGLGWVTAAQLDALGISEALKLATRRAMKSVQRLHAPFSQIVIDGKVNFLAGTSMANYVSTVVKADNLIKEVSAASIIAKVARDRYMTELGEEYNKYGFATNVGYGTATHLKAIKEFGISVEHRRSFEPIRSMVGFSREVEKKKNTTTVGIKGENAAAEYLARAGHQIVVRNFKTKFCEIDIVSVCERKIYFTEVKYRKTDVHGNGLEVITREKQKQMQFAAESFLKLMRGYSEFDPVLAVAAVTGEDFTVSDWFTIF